MPATPHLRSLGAPALLSSPADPAVAMDVGKPLALLTYLTLSGVEATRDHLVDLLWAHVPVERGRQSLRQALWQIRQRLGVESISQMGDRLRVAIPLGSDVADFLRAVTERRPHDAVALYAAPFFQGFAAPGALEFEQWADTMRGRLQTAFIRLGEEAVQQSLDAGKPAAAIATATRLRDVAPDRQEGWRRLIQTLRTAGQAPTALLEAEALEARLAREGEPVEEATSRLVGELRRSPAVADGTPGAPSPWERTELVGREAQFASLLVAWSAAGRGRPQFAHVVAEPGLGKTRLLQELRARLGSAGASVVLVGARPEERDTPYSLAADLASALADLPGGRGVSKQSAASLVALDPRLASRYAEPADPSDGPEGERRRLLALGDLIESVADERATAVLLDDLHWADPTSARVIGGALRRVSGQALVVTTSRPGRAGMPRDERATVLGLDPLGAGAVAALLAAFGSFERDEEAEEISTKLHATSGGSPLRALEALREATNLGALRLEETTWTVADRVGLQQAWEQMRDPADRLRRLGATESSVLLALALWARPISVTELETLTGAGRAAVEEACQRLERGGLAGEVHGEWTPLHHTVAELIQVVASPESLAILHRQVARMRAPNAHDARGRREVVRHLWQGDDEEGVRTSVRRWIREARREGDRRPAGALIEELCPPEVAGTVRARVLRELPWSVRHPLPSWALASAGLAFIAVLLGGVYAWLSQPAALVATVRPLMPSPATPSPVIELQDRLGRVVTGQNGVVIARGLSGATIGGDSAAPLVDGRAEFNDLRIHPGPDGKRSVELLFDGQPLGVLPITELPELEQFRLLWRGVVLNGRAVDPERDTVRVAPGETLTLHPRFSYNAICNCSVQLVVAATWDRDRSRGWQVLKAVGTPRVGGEASQEFRVTAPRTGGIHHLIFGLGPEPTGAFLLSQTNWKVGTPRWNDGNDLADLGPAELAAARRQGSILRQWLFSEDMTEVHGPAGAVRTHENLFPVGIAVLSLRVEGGETR